jgi:hypothetical protein
MTAPVASMRAMRLLEVAPITLPSDSQDHMSSQV